MRASDSERQRTIDELRRHCAAGRLDVDEYASRIEKAMAATTLEELDHLRSDLPMMRIADPAGSPRFRAQTLPAMVGASGSAGRRLSAVAVAALSVAVVLAVVVLSLVAEWAWAAVLLIGWMIGLIQGRSSHHVRWRG